MASIDTGHKALIIIKNASGTVVRPDAFTVAPLGVIEIVNSDGFWVVPRAVGTCTITATAGPSTGTLDLTVTAAPLTLELGEFVEV